MPSNLPLLVYGQLTESGSPAASATVKIRNNSTNQVATYTTNEDGLYLADLSDESKFSEGYTFGQQITVYTIYTAFEGETSFTLASPIYGYEKNITLTAISDSQLVDYTTPQNVYDELDGKTTSDISAGRIVRAIQEAEGLIDTKTGTFFKEVTRTDEVHTGDRYSLDISPDYLDTMNPSVSSRVDSFNSQILNRVKTDYKPVVSITSLSVNGAAVNATDSWTALTQQTGTGGEYVLEDSNAGIIDFLSDYPRLGKRSWKITYVAGHDRDSIDRRVVSLLRVVQRLTTLLACKSIITTKSTGSMFDSTRDVRIGTIEIKAGAMSGKTYLNSIEPEIKELWQELGELGIEVI